MTILLTTINEQIVKTAQGASKKRKLFGRKSQFIAFFTTQRLQRNRGFCAFFRICSFIADYKDGIYEITKEEYQDFMHGKNITMQFNREVEAIYMLKKIGYYCFLCREKTGRVVLLNGGRATTTCIDQLEYYYDHMDRMVAEIQKPLRLFTAYQEQIAKAVRQIGGSGRIHGCIIDIDYYNHLYINLSDISVTPYWASDMVNKRVYPSIP